MPSESAPSGTPTYNRPPAVINAGEYNQARKITRIRSPTTVTFDANIPIEMQRMLLAQTMGMTSEQTQVYNGGLYNHSDELEEEESETSIKFVASSSSSTTSSSQYQGSGTGDRQARKAADTTAKTKGILTKGILLKALARGTRLKEILGRLKATCMAPKLTAKVEGTTCRPPWLIVVRKANPNMYHAQGNYNNQQYNVNYNEYDAPEPMSRSRTY
ncbi:hypothetical protein DFH06DRAFT_1317052 [Mycena polygramma]|nr:hypothetical protein DFH06DRAFT_1317052 [Mycena polygramma]